ncbi:ABC transporter ATP-binding protein [Tanticharoenia sakaeratensis]|uniref:Oligopeptide/dipeptide ABC transporter ATPase n=1 Tax=Tanticharoenia sakaeratensis NBRC 103193 TaxID=1231623 RepID=A0A0D6ML82_9PROT|nr:ABC transporter ATP-binding protein [Tanticharoenia sakaeratensis]GAN54033.1 oligopeptide/dipeptide ABC transporter ATPase [Tanticharoenia sakaeratensis NBRC 103193]GBQ23646.1 oligopeptide ABC transporter ATP-binding protein [Tanticharoenia sakaeratensis NBRC 103193]
MTQDPVLEVSGLRVDFADVAALDAVSFHIARGETLALVGESGSGKSVTALAVMGLLRGGSIRDGRILFSDGEKRVDLAALTARQRRAVQGRGIGMIFQEPMSALNPSMRIGAQIGECLALHRPDIVGRRATRQAAEALLGRTGIADPAQCLEAYPHRLSGGMRQRVMIAMALSARPALLIADEPTTALDASTQGRILALIRELATEMGTSTLFITHDLGAAAVIADRVAVLYAGRLMEEGPIREVLRAPRHPYTRGLLASMPDPSSMIVDATGRRRLRVMPGSVPLPAARPVSCAFAPRCDQSLPPCVAAPVQAREFVGARRVACVRADEWAVAP